MRGATVLLIAAAALTWGCADHAARLDPVSQRAVPVRPVVEYDGVEHAPYADGECAACHDLAGSASFGGGGWPGRDFDSEPVVDPADERRDDRLVVSVAEICTACHDDKTEAALEDDYETVHAPTAEGECTQCHVPHRSPRASLLRTDFDDGVCADCHDRSDHEAVEGLAESGDEDCFGCHDPHGSPYEYLLKEPPE